MKYLGNQISRSVLDSCAAVALIPSILISGCAGGDKPAIVGTECGILPTARNVPPPITRSYSTRAIVRLVTKEKVGRLAGGDTYDSWRFNGFVQGPMIRVRQGDIAELHLSNSPGKNISHNIDLPTVIGPDGGAIASVILLCHMSVFSFEALHPGLFIYHCAAPPVPIHIANGMCGLIFVQPKNSLPPVDKEYYVMQSEFYTTGSYCKAGLQKFDLQKAIDEDPTYVVFNGSVGSMMGANALHVSEGENVRLYVSNIGPNLTSSFHVIGEIFSNVYIDGDSTVTAHDKQTTSIPGGGAAIVELKAEAPGTYMVVDHSIFRAFYKGAKGQFIVSGQPNPSVFAGKTAVEIYVGHE